MVLSKEIVTISHEPKKGVAFVGQNCVCQLCAVASRGKVLTDHTIWFENTPLNNLTLNWFPSSIINVNRFFCFLPVWVLVVWVVLWCQICKIQDSINRNPKNASLCDSGSFPEVREAPGAARLAVASRGRAAIERYWSEMRGFKRTSWGELTEAAVKWRDPNTRAVSSIFNKCQLET